VRRETGDVVKASQLLRHSSVATSESYLHPTRRVLSDALEAMDEAWGR
jgi:hypothetical protein